MVCTCQCHGEAHGTTSAQRRLTLEMAQRQAVDVETGGRVVHVSPASLHFLDGRVEFGWIARRLDGSRAWGKTPEAAASEAVGR